MPIHFVIHNRTKNRFQFAPITKCVSVQNIRIKHHFNSLGSMVYVGDLDCLLSPLLPAKVEELALNDGFPSLEAFFDYFNTDFEGKIIHWTDLRY